MLTVISIFSLLVILFTIIKFDWGIGMYLLYFFLVPVQGLFLTSSFAIGNNLFYILLFLIFFIWVDNKGGIKKTNISIVSPFLFLYIAQALLIPFHTYDISFADQLNYFRIDLTNIILPFVIIGALLVNKKSSILFTQILFIAIIFSSLYTLFLLTKLGENPYMDSISQLLNKWDNSNMDKFIDEGIRQFGYISSVYAHVTEYGIFLILSSVILLYQIKRDSSYLPKVLYGLVLVCTLVCGSRSVLMSEAIVVIVFLIHQRQLNTLIGTATILFLGWLAILEFLPGYMLFITSIGDESASGSSIQMRMEQMEACLISIQENPLFGNGYNWTGWYCLTIGSHPIMHSFESCLIQILCSNGIVGILIWGTFVYLLLRNVKKHFKGNKNMFQNVVALLVGYFSYSFFTGDYGSFKVMIVFYALIIAIELKGLSATTKIFNNRKLTIKF